MAHKLFARVAVASVLVTAVVAVAVLAGSSPQHFRIRDDCDPQTFNAIGAGIICNPGFDGDTTFEEFIEELTEDGSIGSWRFNPDRVEVDRGQGTRLESRGGEFHTFTKVAAFGGGILPDLNELTGSGETRPECGVPGTLAPPSATNLFVDGVTDPEIVVAGPTAGRSAALPRGTTNWQCCIHPWMKSVITVR